ncbi:MAG: hypothetical protein KDA69_20355, partial [Planctomycetaceae bacterium]|nr:hypothetical protein [Planctomycetaceae bacterium]
MTRDPVPATLVRVLQAARVLAKENEAAAVLILSEAAYDFSLVQKEVGHPNLIVASHIPDVQEAAKQDEIEVIALSQEPQTRHMQVSQALLDAIADDLVQTG